MRIRYVGPGAGGVTIRLVGQFRWSPDNGYMTEVDTEMAANLLTLPGDEFAVDKDEPLLTLRDVGPQQAAEMALAGVGSMADLAALDEDGIERLAKAIFANRRQVSAWAHKAREIILGQGQTLRAEPQGEALPPQMEVNDVRVW